MAATKKHRPLSAAEHATIRDKVKSANSDLKLFLAALDQRRGSEQKAIADEALKWAATLLRKNHDYGSAVWDRPVLAPNCDSRTAILVRMSDKISRLKSLLTKPAAEVTDESIDDTISDLGAYCLLLLAQPKESGP